MGWGFIYRLFSDGVFHFLSYFTFHLFVRSCLKTIFWTPIIRLSLNPPFPSYSYDRLGWFSFFKSSAISGCSLLNLKTKPHLINTPPATHTSVTTRKPLQSIFVSVLTFYCLGRLLVFRSNIKHLLIEGSVFGMSTVL